MKKFLLFAVVAILFAACTQDVAVEILSPNIADDAPDTLTVGFEGDDTRIQLNENVKTVWTNGDQVSVFYRSDANQKWEYTGETGARIADLTRVDEGVATEDMKRVVVVYPYNENYYINTDTFNVQATLPAVQTYLKDSYGLNGNIMISQGEYNDISLKSVCGWLKLQLTGNGETVKSITLRGNNGEQVAGELYINSADATAILSSDAGSADDGEIGGVGGDLVFEDTILKEVTLDCDEGVELGTEATAFYIALPPQTYTEGITVDITTINGLAMTQSTDKEVVIERNHIQPMTAFGYNGIFKPANNEIYYTNGSTTEPTEPNDPAAFGDATIQSNTYDAEKECWVITFDKDITEIGERAFYSCRSLTSVTIPDSVTTIGSRAFSSCTSLKEFKGKFAADGGRCLIKDNAIIAYANASGTTYTIPDSVTTIGERAFYGCTTLTSVTIPDSVTTIGRSAFYKCSSLTSVTIPDSVTTIGERVFYGCTTLTSVTIPNSVTTIGRSAFYECSSLTSVTIPDSVTTIGDYAFLGCESLTSVTIPNSVTTIGDWAFQSCYSLTSVTIPDSVTTIGRSAFYKCSSLTSVTIPDSVTTIGDYAFCYCDSLESVTIPDSVTTIGEYAFYECSSLTSVTIGDSVTTIGDWAFAYCISLTSVNIPDSVTTIGYAAFAYCDSLENVTIGDSVTTIGEYAFYGCTTLTSVTIPNSVTTIGNYAFYGCTTLTSVTIGDSVTTIGQQTFYQCISLKYVYCKPITPPTAGNGMFLFHNGEDFCYIGCKIYVPVGSGSLYKAAKNWSDYADYIEEDASL